MAWPIPTHTKNQINKAGQILVKARTGTTQPWRGQELNDFMWAFEVVNNWRSCHGYPINTFQSTLRGKLKTLDPHAIVAQRLKRMESIVHKLLRFRSMELARMQDIGGLRAVVSSLNKVRSLEKNYKESQFNHSLASSYDYISNPKASGYRSIHLIYRYKNPRSPDYDGLSVELQIRTRLQHAWATAVETVGTFLDHALKSSEGPESWLDFFSLIGSAFAHLENTAPVPGYEKLTREETFMAVKEKAIELDVKERLKAFSIVADQICSDKRKGIYHLIVLDPNKKAVTLQAFSQNRLGEANEEYGKSGTSNSQRRTTPSSPSVSWRC